MAFTWLSGVTAGTEGPLDGAVQFVGQLEEAGGPHTESQAGQCCRNCSYLGHLEPGRFRIVFLQSVLFPGQTLKLMHI